MDFFVYAVYALWSICAISAFALSCCLAYWALGSLITMGKAVRFADREEVQAYRAWRAMEFPFWGEGHGRRLIELHEEIRVAESKAAASEAWRSMLQQTIAHAAGLRRELDEAEGALEEARGQIEDLRQEQEDRIYHQVSEINRLCSDRPRHEMFAALNRLAASYGIPERVLRDEIARADAAERDLLKRYTDGSMTSRSDQA